jgi:hypothetical protein
VGEKGIGESRREGIGGGKIKGDISNKYCFFWFLLAVLILPGIIFSLLVSTDSGGSFQPSHFTGERKYQMLCSYYILIEGGKIKGDISNKY